MTYPCSSNSGQTIARPSQVRTRWETQIWQCHVRLPQTVPRHLDQVSFWSVSRAMDMEGSTYQHRYRLAETE